MHRSFAVATLTAALLALPTAALAHPAFNPSSIPAGQSVDAMLVVPHGCAPGGGMPEMEEEGAAAEPTVELAVQQQDGVTLAPGEVDGWEVSDDGEAWVWSDAGGATTDVIQFPLTITLDDGLAAGEQLYLKAFQACVDGSAFQWIGTPDAEAQWPAVLLEVSDGEIGEAEMDESMEMDMDHDEMDMGDGESMDDESMDEMAEVDEMADDDMAMDDAADESGGVPTGLLIGLGLLLVAAVAGFMIRSRSAA